jgi:hypothetical protein
LLKVIVISLVELPAKSILSWTHSLQQESDTEEIHALADEDVDSALIDEGIVTKDPINIAEATKLAKADLLPESSWQTCTICTSGRVDSEFTTTLIYTGIVNLGCCQR